MMLKRILPLLAASTPLCSSFAQLNPVSRSSIGGTRQTHVLRAALDDDGDANNNIGFERLGKAAGSALVAVALSFSSIASPAPFSVPSANAAPSIMISRATAPSEDDSVIKELERETRSAEKEAKADERKARIEKSREGFFEYEAKTAEQQEARIEADERRAFVEAEKDKKQAEELKALELEDEREEALASTKEEKAAKQKEEKALLKKIKELERKEKKAERLERIFLAEEEQEKNIVRQKEDAALKEEKKIREGRKGI